MKKLFLAMIFFLVCGNAQASLQGYSESNVFWQTLRFGGIGLDSISLYNEWEFVWATTGDDNGFNTKSTNRYGWSDSSVLNGNEYIFSNSTINSDSLRTSTMSNYFDSDYGYSDGQSHRSAYFSVSTSGYLTISVNYLISAFAVTDKIYSSARAEADAYGRLYNLNSKETNKDKGQMSTTVKDCGSSYDSSSGTLYLKTYFNAGDVGFFSFDSYSIVGHNAGEGGGYSAVYSAGEENGYSDGRRDCPVLVGAPSKATHTYPSGLLESSTSTFTWISYPASTWYRLWVGYPGDIKVFAQWYEFSNICSGPSCSVTLESELLSGNYEWFIQSWDDHGSIWSDGMTFTIQDDDSPPSKIIHTSPSGQLTSSTSTFTWVADPASTWYRLWVGYPGDQKIFSQWYEASEICSDGNCSVILETERMDGNYEWYIKSWNDYGKVWSDGMSFTVSN